MAKTKQNAVELLVAMALMAATLFAVSPAHSQVPVIPALKQGLKINAVCTADRAVFRIQNGFDAWKVPGEIIILSEQERRILSRRAMRFQSNQTATYRVPVQGEHGIAGPIRIVLMSGGETQKPLAHARLDCTQG